MRTYSEDEVSAIIARAVERQKEADAGAAESGLTLEEIERLGRESGIDPAHLRAAASEVDSVGRTLDRQTSQTDTEIVVERWIDAPFGLEAWEDVVVRLREEYGPSAGAALGSGDSVRQVGASYEWSHTSGLGIRTRVTVSPRDGRTRLRMTRMVGLASPVVEGAGYGAMIALFLMTLTAGGLEGLGMTVGAAVPVLAFLMWFVVAAPAVTVFDRRWRAQKLRDLDALADDLTPVLNRRPSGSVLEDTMEPEAAFEDGPAPLLDLDALDDSVLEAEVSRRRRSRA